MARTIRRRKAKFNYSQSVLRDWVRVPGFMFFRWIEIDRHSIEGKKAIARYHADAGFGDYGHACPPRWYRHNLNRAASNMEKQHLHRWKRLGNDRYEIPKPVRVKDAGWYW